MAEVAGRCQIYKRATRAVVNWLAAEVPHKQLRKALQQGYSVQTIADAAQAVASTSGSRVPENVLLDLSTSIRLRKEVHTLCATGSDSDARHVHFISVLEGARATLQARAHSASRGTADLGAGPSHTDVRPATISNAFAALAVEDPEPAVDATPSHAQRPRLVGEFVRINGVSSNPKLNDSTGFVVAFLVDTGRYKVSCGGKAYCLLPEKLSVCSDKASELDVLGEDVAFEAACFLVDIEAAMTQIDRAWAEFRCGECSLLAATALTNACVRHAERLAADLEIRCSALNSLEHIVSACCLQHAVRQLVHELAAPYEKVLGAVSEAAFGSATETVQHWLSDPRSGKRTGMVFGFKLAQAIARGNDPALVEAARARAMSQLGLSADKAFLLIDLVAVECVCLSASVGDREQPTLAASLRREDFLTGDSGLLHTSSFLRTLCAAGRIKPSPRVGNGAWSAPKPGYFGPPWDEAESPAESASDLLDYMGGALPALSWFAYYECWHGPIPDTRGEGRRLQLPDFKFEALMPLWQLLQSAMESERVSAGLVFAMHACVTSLVRVNGERRCRRLQVRFTVAMGKLQQQLARDHPVFKAGAPHLSEDGVNPNISVAAWWVKNTINRATSDPPTATGPMAVTARRQRDQALLLNPWVVGQQLLVATLSCGLCVGATMLDCVAQTRLVLHVYNAMRCARAIDQPIALLETLLSALAPGRALWISGRPSSNFTKHWHHALGMSANTNPNAPNRALVPIEPFSISAAYKRTAANDFSDVAPSAEEPLQPVLDAIRDAFKRDELVGVNMLALGALFLKLVDTLVKAAGVESEVAARSAEIRTESQERRGSGRRKSKQPTEASAGRQAIYEVLTSELLFLCEREQGVQGTLIMPANLKHISVDSLPPLTRRERSKLAAAAEAIVQTIGALSSSDYMLPV